MITIGFVLCLVTVLSHMFYDDMPVEWFNKIGGHVKRSTYICAVASAVFIASGSLVSVMVPDAKAVDHSTDFAAIEKQLADLRKDVADLRSDVAMQQSSMSEDTDGRFTDLEEKINDALQNAIKKQNKKLNKLENRLDNLETSKTSEVSTSTPKKNQSGVYVLRSVYLRKSADSDSDILTIVPVGTTCTYLDSAPGWYKVKYNGQTGFISQRLTEKH